MEEELLNKSVGLSMNLIRSSGFEGNLAFALLKEPQPQGPPKISFQAKLSRFLKHGAPKCP